jgi:hypothetical protein
MFRQRRAAARCAALVLALPIVGAAASATSIDPELLEGRAPTAEELRPSVEAAFTHESYAPGDAASLRFFSRASGVVVQILHSGPEHTPTVGNDELEGMPVTTRTWIGAVRPGEDVAVRVGGWPSGVYVARLRSARGLVGFAPFVVRPRRLGTARVAVVMPTFTWQAYNLRDDDGDGKGDSWYASWSHHTVRLTRPFLNRGVPFNFRNYDLPFLHWLAWNGHSADVLTDADLDRVSGASLARAYRLIVFPGHHEYVTTHEYDAIRTYRDRGGHLMFLSANDFFWQVVQHGDLLERTHEWRDLGRPEAALIGVQYRGNDRGEHRAPWIARNVQAEPWIFAGTGIVDGAPFGSGGIEIDETAAASPATVHVLADIRDLFGPGFTAQMAYYATPRGAEVFAAGAFTLAGSALQPTVGRMLENVWEHLGGDAPSE